LNEAALQALGGVDSLEKKLKTSFKNGLSSNDEDLALRIKLYGDNTVSPAYITPLLTEPDHLL
jgi:hypothetical protein